MLGFIFFDFFSNLGAQVAGGDEPPSVLSDNLPRFGSQGLAPKVWLCQAFRSFGPAHAQSLNIPRGVGKFTQCMPACHIHREQSGYNCSPSVQISQIGLANCCVRKKFRPTVDLGSFPFRYKRAGAERRGKNSEVSDVPLRSRVRSPSSAGRHSAGIVPGEAEVGDHRIALTSGMRESRGLKRS
jgi:hypothetical protein